MRAYHRNILAVYDISNVRRLQKVANLVSSYGARVQKSVFELHLGKKDLIKLHAKVGAIIDKMVDSVRYYAICDPDWQKRDFLGKNVSDNDDWQQDYIIV